ncbi:hypothetical protein AAFF_G00211290 [Aldrovandia affinis]|uniref:Uncharacterized protein n=1 Tax=Aldrovandia affinis TaxID=143900 RepID=A0AAD7SXG2_9TELE|nr:hypothetical protein AAFF_G00211290 [Aldrovandia affinis]
MSSLFPFCCTSSCHELSLWRSILEHKALNLRVQDVAVRVLEPELVFQKGLFSWSRDPLKAQRFQPGPSTQPLPGSPGGTEAEKMHVDMDILHRPRVTLVINI